MTAPFAADAAQAAELIKQLLTREPGIFSREEERAFRAVLDRLQDLEQESEAASSPEGIADYGRWLTRNLAAAFDAGWHTHDNLVTGTLATLGADKRRSCGQAWITERLADLSTDGEQAARDGQGGEAATGCLCPHDLMPDGTLVPDGVIALGCPVHDGQGGEEQ